MKRTGGSTKSKGALKWAVPIAALVALVLAGTWLYFTFTVENVRNVYNATAILGLVLLAGVVIFAMRSKSSKDD